MARKLPILRVAGPTILVSLLLFAACSASAFFLYRLHADTAEGLAEDIDSRKKAVEIETTLRSVITLVRKSRLTEGSEQIEPLHETLKDMIEKDAAELANTAREVQLHNKLQDSFRRYYDDVWPNRLDAERYPTEEKARAALLAILEKEAIP